MALRDWKWGSISLVLAAIGLTIYAAAKGGWWSAGWYFALAAFGVSATIRRRPPATWRYGLRAWTAQGILVTAGFFLQGIDFVWPGYALGKIGFFLMAVAVGAPVLLERWGQGLLERWQVDRAAAASWKK